MSKLPDHHTERVVLPSGKTIEVVYFEDRVPVRHADRAGAPPPDLGPALHVCVWCDSQLVYPVKWSEASDTHWHVSLRCPECARQTSGTYEQQLVERLDSELDRGTAALVDDLRRLTTANMQEEIGRFASALAENQILPEDF